MGRGRWISLSDRHHHTSLPCRSSIDERRHRSTVGAIARNAHIRHEFVDHDVAATMKTMAAEPYVHNVPTLIGGDGHAGVVDFYTHPSPARCLPLRASSRSLAR